MIESYNSSLEILANSFSAVVGLNLEWQFQLVMNMIISAGLRALALLCCLWGRLPSKGLALLRWEWW